ncbi:MAG: hypothetical protein RLY31_169 [Bacteroidota bacterium]|jgi:hypothetical protein
MEHQLIKIHTIMYRLCKLSILMLAGLLPACQQTGKEGTDTDASQPAVTSVDTAAKVVATPADDNPQAAADVQARMKVISDYIDIALQNQGDASRFNTMQFRPKRFDERDFIGVLEMDGAPFRVTTTFYDGPKETKTQWFVKDGQLVLVKHREWIREGDPPYARELWSFLENEKVFFSVDRTVGLEQGQKPAPLLSQPMAESKFDLDSLGSALLAEFSVIQSLQTRAE